MVKTFEHSQASSQRTSHTGLIKAWAKNGKRSGSGFRTWPDANVAPPVYRVDLTRPVVDAEHGKAVSIHTALVVPRQADRKAGPGETAWRGLNKPTPVCNGQDMPTSIWSFVARKSMEPFSLRNANDDRHPSIGASQARHEDCRGARPFSMAKVESSAQRFVRRACPTGTPRAVRCPLKGLSRVRGNSHARF